MCDSHLHFRCISKVNYSSLIQGCNVIPTNMSNFQPLEVMNQVAENLNKLTKLDEGHENTFVCFDAL